ncbi:MAG: hypothetical protein LJE68_04860 [Rhodobacter sp.]|nr:hypothetical protein [Rhodobacter sp.]
MSFVIAFTPFVRIEVSTSDGAVAPFVLAPTERTRTVMKNHEIISRENADGLSLYAKSNPAVVPALLAPIAARTRFSFAMRLTDAGFFDRYFPDSANGTTQILLDNLDGAGAIQTAGALTTGAAVDVPDLVAAGPESYPVRLDVSGGAPPVLEAQDRFTAAVVGSTLIVAEPGQPEVVTSLDLSQAPDAALRLVAAAPANLDQPIYADDEISDTGAAGVIDIYWDQPQSAVPAGTGAIFTAQFLRRP